MSDWFGASSESPDAPSFRETEERLGLRLPAALCELLARLGNRGESWNVQDTLLTPPELYVESGHLIIACENQGVFRWAIPRAALDDVDPVVVIFAPNADNHLNSAAPSVTEFAAWWLLTNAKFSSRGLFRANGQAEDLVLDAVARVVPRLGVPDINWHVSPMRLHGTPRLIVEVDAFTWLWITAVDLAEFEAVVSLAEATGMVWEVIERPQ